MINISRVPMISFPESYLPEEISRKFSVNVKLDSQSEVIFTLNFYSKNLACNKSQRDALVLWSNATT